MIRAGLPLDVALAQAGVGLATTILGAKAIYALSAAAVAPALERLGPPVELGLRGSVRVEHTLAGLGTERERDDLRALFLNRELAFGETRKRLRLSERHPERDDEHGAVAVGHEPEQREGRDDVQMPAHGCWETLPRIPS